MTDDGSERDGREGAELPRRRLLGALGAALGTAALGAGTAGGLTGALGALAGCGPRDSGGDEEPAAEAVRIPVDRLSAGERARVTVGGVPVELLRTGEGLTARSLRCTHFGCVVSWQPEREAYVCPCHDGAFAPDGRVIYGPPDHPLPTLPVERDGDEWVIHPLPPASGSSEGASS